MDEQVKTGQAYVMVTVEQAKAWLEDAAAAKMHRPIDSRRVAMWVEEMRKGAFNHQVAPIQFDWNDVLINGRHRLSALVQVGEARLMWLQGGCDPEIIHKIDTGYKRTGGNSLYMEGFVDGNVIASVVRGIHGIQTDNPYRLTLPNHEIALWAKKNRGEIQLITRSWRKVTYPFYSLWYPSLDFIYTYRLNTPMPQILETFLDGNPSREGCPAHAAREWMIKHNRKGVRIQPWAVLETATKAFEDERLGNYVRRYIMPAKPGIALPKFEL